MAALLLVFPLLQDVEPGHRFDGGAGLVIERGIIVRWVTGGDPVNTLSGMGLRARVLVSDSTVGASVPGVEIDHSAVHPATVWHAEVLQGHSDYPVWAGVDLGDQREKMFLGVNSEHGKSSADHI